MKQKCQQAESEAERVKADNVKLYERMRFVRDYSSSGASLGAGAGVVAGKDMGKKVRGEVPPRRTLMSGVALLAWDVKEGEHLRNSAGALVYCCNVFLSVVRIPCPL